LCSLWTLADDVIRYFSGVNWKTKARGSFSRPHVLKFSKEHRCQCPLQPMLSLRAYAGMGMTPAELAVLYWDYAAVGFSNSDNYRWEDGASRHGANMDRSRKTGGQNRRRRTKALRVIYETPPKAEKSA
jgi:hypothetical protein